MADHRQLTPDRIADLADGLGLPLTDEELDRYASIVGDQAAAIESYDPAELSPPPTADVDRPPGRAGDDELNAWITRFRLSSGDGDLSDLRIGLKDNIAVAGYPMTCGSKVLDDFVPTIDATVTRRLLDSGAALVGKCNMEGFAWSGSSDITDYGTVPNPHDDAYLAGGSSSGSAAAVAAGDCEAAIGGDQGGSIRIPASWCGVVGLKPTHGLVPYTGIVPLDPTIDHVGPIATDVTTAARVLAAIAGEDVHDGVGLDPRQSGEEAGASVEGLDGRVDDCRIGVLEEGFGWDAGDPRVDEAVLETVDRLADAGADVDRVSVEHHRDVLALIAPLEAQGGYRTMIEDGVPTHGDGWYWTELAAELRSRVADRGALLPPTAKSALLLGAHLIRERGVEPYASAKNAVLRLRSEYDAALATRDALVMPTVPMLPFERDDSLDVASRLGRIVENHRNTATFDHTHHPALSVPCGAVKGLPVGVQFVGSAFDERTLFRLGRAVETLGPAG